MAFQIMGAGVAGDDLCFLMHNLNERAMTSRNDAALGQSVRWKELPQDQLSEVNSERPSARIARRSWADTQLTSVGHPGWHLHVSVQYT